MNTPEMPTHLAIEINSNCNRKCPWCPNIRGDRGTEYLGIEIIESVLLQCAGHIKEMNFNNFNEPCLDDRLPTIVGMAKKILGDSTTLYLNTNGDYLTKDLFLELKRQGISLFNVSDYDGTSKIDFTPIHPLSDITLYNRGGLLGETKQPLQRVCPKPFFSFVVNYKGQAVLCCSDYRGDVVLGDLRTESVRDIWHGEILTRYREQLNQNSREGLTLCSVCDF